MYTWRPEEDVKRPVLSLSVSSLGTRSLIEPGARHMVSKLQDPLFSPTGLGFHGHVRLLVWVLGGGLALGSQACAKSTNLLTHSLAPPTLIFNLPKSFWNSEDLSNK